MLNHAFSKYLSRNLRERISRSEIPEAEANSGIGSNLRAVFLALVALSVGRRPGGQTWWYSPIAARVLW